MQKKKKSCRWKKICSEESQFFCTSKMASSSELKGPAENEFGSLRGMALRYVAFELIGSFLLNFVGIMSVYSSGAVFNVVNFDQLTVSRLLLISLSTSMVCKVIEILTSLHQISAIDVWCTSLCIKCVSVAICGWSSWSS